MITHETTVVVDSPLESEAKRLAPLGGDVTPYVARIEALEAELAALKAGMVNRVGQRFVANNGNVMVVVEHRHDAGRFPWLLRDQKSGFGLSYTSSGESICGNVVGDNLVGPAPDELAEAKADAARFLSELKTVKRERDQFRAALGESLSRSSLATLSPEAYIKALLDAEPGFSADDLCGTFRMVAESTYRIDERNESEGFGETHDSERFVVFEMPRSLTFAAKVPTYAEGWEERDFKASRVEVVDSGMALYVIEVA